MATNYPSSLDTFTNPNSANTLDSPPHSLQHSDVNDAIEAIEAKLGVGTSTAGSATAGYALVNTSGGTTAYTTLGTAGISSGTATSGALLTANGSGGVTFVDNTSGLVHINTTTFSGVASQAIPTGTFTSTYRNYRVIISNITTSVNNTPYRMRYRISGTDTTSNTYYRYGAGSTSASLTNYYELNTAYYLGSGSSTSTVPSFVIVDLSNIQTATRSLMSAIGYSAENGTGYCVSGFQSDTGSQFDAINIYPDTGNISGTIQVFAYKQ